MVINVAVCDDIREDIDMICHKTEEIFKNLSLDYKIQRAGKKEEIYSLLSAGNTNVLLLDINMPDTDGFEIASRFGDKIKFIIFVSGNQEYVYESIKYKPFRFIRKSHLDELNEAFDEINKYYCSNSSSIEIKIVDGGYISVNFNDIVYIESNGGKLFIYTENYRYEVRDSLKNIEFMLDGTFMRVHRGFIVNLAKIYQIKSGSLDILINGKFVSIPLKRGIHNQIKEKFVEVMR